MLEQKYRQEVNEQTKVRKETLSDFYCEACRKQYKNVVEMGLFCLFACC